MKRMEKQPALSGNSFLKKVFIITFLARRASIETLFMETSASRSTIGENKTFFKSCFIHFYGVEKPNERVELSLT